MAELSERIQTADWQKEKHVPLIDCPETVKANEFFQVKATLGKAVAHPNTTEHHIRWIDLYFHPEGEKFSYHVGRFEFCAWRVGAWSQSGSGLYPSRGHRLDEDFQGRHAARPGLLQHPRPMAVQQTDRRQLTTAASGQWAKGLTSNRRGR